MTIIRVNSTLEFSKVQIFFEFDFQTSRGISVSMKFVWMSFSNLEINFFRSIHFWSIQKKICLSNTIYISLDFHLKERARTRALQKISLLKISLHLIFEMRSDISKFRPSIFRLGPTWFNFSNWHFQIDIIMAGLCSTCSEKQKTWKLVDKPLNLAFRGLIKILR